MSFAICFVGITRIGISSGSGKAGQMVGFWACFGGGFWWVVGAGFGKVPGPSSGFGRVLSGLSGVRG